MSGAFTSLITSPRDRRLIDQFLTELSSNRVALLLGAGTDIALSGSYGWDQLVKQLFPPSAAPDDRLLSSWVVELAAVARHLLGDDVYYDQIARGTGSKRRATPLWSALKNLSTRIPLVVTTNYSRWVFKALARGMPPLVVDRTMLRSARLPEPGQPFSRATLVHLHGRGTEVVLDRFAYDRAQYGDLLYEDFLVQLFERWSVFAIGLSFSDPPMRLAASLARVRRPELGRSHLWIDKGPSDRRYRWHARAAFLAYSIRRIECSAHKQAAQLACAISAATAADPLVALSHVQRQDYRPLAESLDAAGDYEAPYQRTLFRDHRTTQALCNELCVACIDGVLLARLERHLRHHLFIIQPRAEAIRIRTQLWNRVAMFVRQDKSTARSIFDNPQLHLDFMLGGLEVGEINSFRALLRSYGYPAEPILRDRLKGADEIWPSAHRRSWKKLNELRKWAAGVGWEAIESKVSFDQARAHATELIANGKRRFAAREIETVIATSTMSLRTAQYAGTLRRAIGSLILQSLWVPHDAEAKAVLRSAVALAQEEVELESALKDAIAWAWQRLFDNSREAFQDVGWRAPPSKAALEVQKKFWSTLVPFARR